MADSLEAVLLSQQAYLGNLRDIVNGTAGDSAVTETRTEGVDAPEVLHDVSLTAGTADSAFRTYIESRDRFELSGNAIPREKTSIADHTFFTPVRGMVTQHRSEEHTSELQSLMRISYAVFCLKK